MRYVLDSCVSFKWHVREAGTDEALRLREDLLSGDAELLAPDILPVENTHSLTRAERQGRITPAEGAVRLQDVLTLLPILYASLPLLPRAYEISSRARIGTYDCLYVALAEREGCELVTSDMRLINGLKLPFIRDLATF